MTIFVDKINNQSEYYCEQLRKGKLHGKQPYTV